jgi:hypothetical protein
VARRALALDDVGQRGNRNRDAFQRDRRGTCPQVLVGSRAVDGRREIDLQPIIVTDDAIEIRFDPPCRPLLRPGGGRSCLVFHRQHARRLPHRGFLFGHVPVIESNRLREPDVRQIAVV